MTSAGNDWLLSCVPHPRHVQWSWEAGEFALVTSTAWTVVEASLLRSHAVLREFQRMGKQAGPVLAYSERNLAWWLVGDGAEAHLAGVKELSVKPRGWQLPCPPAHVTFQGIRWLENPDGSGRLTDVCDLRSAVETVR
ncbi:hypothetical protein AB0A77_37790 [Streptomyces varsoviensis]|uniref:hypothetical protein n=1 Tax=Streptomyces varsoviensis TaxID=67373 RepID=UPI0033F5726D